MRVANAAARSCLRLGEVLRYIEPSTAAATQLVVHQEPDEVTSPAFADNPTRLDGELHRAPDNRAEYGVIRKPLVRHRDEHFDVLDFATQRLAVVRHIHAPQSTPVAA